MYEYLLVEGAIHYLPQEPKNYSHRYFVKSCSLSVSQN